MSDLARVLLEENKRLRGLRGGLRQSQPQRPWRRRRRSIRSPYTREAGAPSYQARRVVSQFE
jgi:hypothetical protein